jgi:hypothetical protein
MARGRSSTHLAGSIDRLKKIKKGVLTDEQKTDIFVVGSSFQLRISQSALF